MIDGNLGLLLLSRLGNLTQRGAIDMRSSKAARQSRQFLRFLCRTCAVVAAVVRCQYCHGGRSKANGMQSKLLIGNVFHRSPRPFGVSGQSVICRLISTLTASDGIVVRE